MSQSTTVYQSLVSQLKGGRLSSSILWLEGEERFFIDSLVALAETSLIPPEHQAFNQQTIFGQDVSVGQLISIFRRAALGFDKHLVIVRSAQLLRDIDQLVTYIENPNPSCICCFAYVGKVLDKRKSLAKTLSKKNATFTFNRLYPNQLQEWLAVRCNELGLAISHKAAQLLLDHVGNQLPNIDQELKKLKLNAQGRKIEEDDIYTYVEISKVYNFFEFQEAFVSRNIKKAYEIASYFQQHEKKFPLQWVLVMLHSFFTKLYILHEVSSKDRSHIATALGVSPFFVKDYLTAQQQFSFKDIEVAILLLAAAFRSSVGIDSGSDLQDLSLTTLVHKLFHLKDFSLNS